MILSITILGYLTQIAYAIIYLPDGQLREKRQFGSQDSSLLQTLQGLQAAQQQQAQSQRPSNNHGQGFNGKEQGQGFSNPGIGGFNPGGFSNGQEGSSKPGNGGFNQGEISTSQGQSYDNQAAGGSGQSGWNNGQQGSVYSPSGSSNQGGTDGQGQGFGGGNPAGFSNGEDLIGGASSNQGSFGSSQSGFGSTNNIQGTFGNNPLANRMTTVRSPLNIAVNENSLDAPIRDCILRCPSTNQYNPVCGDDNVSYTNVQKLRCAQRCNKQVQQVYAGSCLTTPAP